MYGVEQVKDVLISNKNKIDDLFHYLHMNPEISWEEVGTTAHLKKVIEDEGFRVHTFDDCTGLVVEKGEGPYCIGIRADMDAL